VEDAEIGLLREIRAAGNISVFDAIEIGKFQKAFTEFERIVKGGPRLRVAREIGDWHRRDPNVEGIATEYNIAKVMLVAVEDLFLFLDRLVQSEEKKDRKVLRPRKWVIVGFSILSDARSVQTVKIEL
jgi:hypothetical protein